MRRGVVVAWVAGSWAVGFLACSGDDATPAPVTGSDAGCVVAPCGADAGKDATFEDASPSRDAASEAASDAATHAPGSLDLSFGGTGAVTVDFADAGDDLEDLIVLADGRTVGVGVGTVGANGRIALAALLANGTLDPSFGTADSGVGVGKTTAELIPGTFSGASRVFEADGGLLVSGYRTAEVAALAFQSNGAVNASYASSGSFTQSLSGVQNVPGAWAVRRPDGKLVIAGNEHVNASNDDAFFAQLDTHGALDPSFGPADASTPGFETVDIASFDAPLDLALQSDGKIVVSGFMGSPNATAILFRLGADGMLDATFAAGDDGGLPGVATLSFSNDDEAPSIAIQSDDGIVVVHRALSSTHVVRYTSAGLLDTSFATGGIYTATAAGFTKISLGSVALQADGKILLGGYAVETSSPALKLAVVRLNSDGTVDSAFGNGGVAVAGFAAGDARGNALSVQADGRIVIGGFVEGVNEDFALARFWP